MLNIPQIRNTLKLLRKNQTPQEKILWNILRNRQFFNLKFKRQVPIENYIVDLCDKKMLIIELDGAQHNFDNNINYDKERTEFLENLGYKVIRFWNNEIDDNIEGVLQQLEMIIRER